MACARRAEGTGFVSRAIAYALCKPQCDEKNVGDEEFGRSMGGDVLERVLDLVIEETIDLFPQGRRAVLKKVLTKSQAFAEKAKTPIETRLAAGELDAAIDALLEPESSSGEHQMASKTNLSEKYAPPTTKIQPVICRAHQSTFEMALKALPMDWAL